MTKSDVIADGCPAPSMTSLRATRATCATCSAISGWDYFGSPRTP